MSLPKGIAVKHGTLAVSHDEPARQFVLKAINDCGNRAGKDEFLDANHVFLAREGVEKCIEVANELINPQAKKRRRDVVWDE